MERFGIPADDARWVVEFTKDILDVNDARIIVQRSDGSHTFHVHSIAGPFVAFGSLHCELSIDPFGPTIDVKVSGVEFQLDYKKYTERMAALPSRLRIECDIVDRLAQEVDKLGMLERYESKKWQS